MIKLLELPVLAALVYGVVGDGSLRLLPSFSLYQHPGE
jgi:hypothetical protein